MLRIPVGVVVERRKTDLPWGDFIWRGVGVLPGEPEMTPWTVLREQDEATLYYAGSASVDLYRSGTPRYRDNLATGSPYVWIVTEPVGGRLALHSRNRHGRSRGRGSLHGGRRQSR